MSLFRIAARIASEDPDGVSNTMGALQQFTAMWDHVKDANNGLNSPDAKERARTYLYMHLSDQITRYGEPSTDEEAAAILKRMHSGLSGLKKNLTKQTKFDPKAEATLGALEDLIGSFRGGNMTKPLNSLQEDVMDPEAAWRDTPGAKRK